MAGFRIAQGTTYRYREGEGDDHLHIIITDPSKKTGCVLVMNIWSVKGSKFEDETCVLQGGDHPFVRHPSWVVYDRAFLESVGRLRRQYQIGAIYDAGSLANGVLRRIQSGAFETTSVPFECMDALREQGIGP